MSAPGDVGTAWAGTKLPPARGHVQVRTAWAGTQLRCQHRGVRDESIEAVAGDLTTQHVDVIVNAANSSLLGGGGVDGAIHRAAGPQLLAACRRLRAEQFPDGLPVGEAVATPGFGLPAAWVVHTVGPNRHAGQTDPALLTSCFTTSLDVADALPARSVAFPAISAGVYGWDVGDVARIAVAAVRSWEAAHVELVRFVLFSPTALAAFDAALHP